MVHLQVIYVDCALHSHIHTPTAEESIQGTNLHISRNYELRDFLKGTSTLTLVESNLERDNQSADESAVSF